jgi:hypothetical protein
MRLILRSVYHVGVTLALVATTVLLFSGRDGRPVHEVLGLSIVLALSPGFYRWIRSHGDATTATASSRRHRD